MEMKRKLLKAELNKLAEPELWRAQMPQCGDAIRKRDGLFYHHALYVSDDEIIHMTYGQDGIMGHEGFLETTTMEAFASKRKIEVRQFSAEEAQNLHPIDQRIAAARKHLGKVNYDLLFSNCEHYVTFFLTGRFVSSQVRKIVNRPIVKNQETGMNHFLGKIYNSLDQL